MAAKSCRVARRRIVPHAACVACGWRFDAGRVRPDVRVHCSACGTAVVVGRMQSERRRVPRSSDVALRSFGPPCGAGGPAVDSSGRAALVLGTLIVTLAAAFAAAGGLAPPHDEGHLPSCECTCSLEPPLRAR